MTDEQIIKALDCCHSELGNMCSICPLFDPDNDYCEDELHKNTLNLINRQAAEIEQWKEEANRWQDAFCKVNEDLSTIKSEAIKEFAERLKRTSIGLEIGDDKKFKMTVVSTVAIDNLVKEMTEVENDV